MFTDYTQRPYGTRAIRVTIDNYQDVADYIRDTIADNDGVDITAPIAHAGHRACLAFTAQDAAPHTRRVVVPIPGFLTVSDVDGDPVYQGHDADMFTAQYAPDLTDPTHVGLDPDHAPTDRATAAVQTLAGANLPLAHMFGPYDPSHPNDYVYTHGLLVRPLVGNRVRVDHTFPAGPNRAALLARAKKALTDAGFSTQTHDSTYLAAVASSDI